MLSITQGVTINLKEGWSEDGFGTRDTISGIETIHGTSFGDTIYGSENYERYFVNGGNNTINSGGGGDRASYAPGRGASTDFELTYIDGSVHVKGENTLDILKNISSIEFMDDSKIFTVDNDNGNIKELVKLVIDGIGTDEDDIIDASKLDSDIRNIYPGKGNDTVTNATSNHTIASGPGEDTISGEKFGYALWNATQSVTINLKEGWSEDGFGTRDTISGIETIHGSSYGDTIYGSENYEKYFVNGGNNTIDGGGGGDRASYAPGRGASTDFEITYIDESVHVKGENTLDILKNISSIEFMDDSKIFNVSYFSSPIKAKLSYKPYTFYDSTIAPEYTYAGVTTKAQLV